MFERLVVLNPFLPYIAGGALILAAGAGYKVRDWQCDAAYAKAIERSVKKEREMRNALDQKGRDFETAKAGANAVGAARATDIRTVYRTVPVPYADCAAPDSVVGLLQGGVDAANAAASGQP